MIFLIFFVRFLSGAACYVEFIIFLVLILCAISNHKSEKKDTHQRESSYISHDYTPTIIEYKPCIICNWPFYTDLYTSETFLLRRRMKFDFDPRSSFFERYSRLKMEDVCNRCLYSELYTDKYTSNLPILFGDTYASVGKINIFYFYL
jgi:hypothetical protein